MNRKALFIICLLFFPGTASAAPLGSYPTLKPIEITEVYISPPEIGPIQLEKDVEYSIKIRYTTTVDLKNMTAYYTIVGILPYGASKVCPFGICSLGPCVPDTCVTPGPCDCDIVLELPWEDNVAIELNLVGNSTSTLIGQGTSNPKGYIIAETVSGGVGSVSGSYQTFKCIEYAGGGFPGCAYDFSCQGFVTDDEPIVRCRDCDDCKIKCARACGEATLCVETPASLSCEDCCETKTCAKPDYPPYDGIGCFFTPYPEEQEMCACVQACRGNCEANTSFCYIINLLRVLVGIIAAAFLALNGLRLVLSDDPEHRLDAKQGIWYTITGALIVLIASYLVSYLYVGELIC